MRTLTLDIETSPHIVFRWGELWRPAATNLDMLIEEGRILCVAAKWLDKRKVQFFRGEGMIEAVRDLLDEADQVVHFNGQRFDIPHINREIAVRHLIKPSPFKHVDLKNVVSKEFQLASNKLAHVLPTLHLAEKEATGGFGLWLGTMSNDPDAWAKMERYNKQDVRATEELFIELRDHGWLSGRVLNPGLDPDREDAHSCPTCGSYELWRRGFTYSGQSRYVKFQCQLCGSYHRSTKSDFSAKRKGI